ncbi:WD repeat-containing protein JIP5 [Scheffersomyces xylosifermentans]|uniref:WD repeat-containing protein JIP5 n=1 Tax=Scheffersomyces xylosifermentans TaxID=1304137 RepID=UPI00315CD925
MGKRKSNSANAARLLESNVSPILEVNYSDPLFTVAAHPTKPILLSGLVTGHVYCNTYDAEALEERQSAKREEISLLEKEAFKSGKVSHVNKSISQSKKTWWSIIKDHKDVPEESAVVTNWKTKRHKGSCRHAIFEPLEDSVGESIYTVGTDHIIKKASTETGKVIGKVDVSSSYPNQNDSITKLCHSSSHPFLLAGTENGHVLIYDSKNLNDTKLKFKVSQAHDDAINHILAMPSVSAYHYLTLGSTTLSHIDIRKGIITQSDNQDDELLSMCFATDQVTEGKNDTVLVAHGEGIVTIWKNSKNSLMDQLTRIKVNKSASIDAIIPTMNADDDELAASVWCGDSEGLLHRVNYKKGRVVETRVHSNGRNGGIDEVGLLEIDYDYRLISAGMDSMKIWSNQENDEEEGISDSDDDNSDSDSDLGSSSGSGNEDDDDDDDDDEEEGEEEKAEVEEKPKLAEHPLANRSKRNIPAVVRPSNTRKKTIDINKLTKSQKARDDEEEPEPEKKKQKVAEKKLSTKQLRNMQKHEHGIKRFEGL